MKTFRTFRTFLSSIDENAITTFFVLGTAFAFAAMAIAVAFRASANLDAFGRMLADCSAC